MAHATQALANLGNQENSYSPGSLVTLKSTGYRTFRIIQALGFTMSCVFLAQSLDFQDQLVLKLFDRRFAQGLRRHEDAKPWSESPEQEYSELIDGGDADKLFQYWSECLSEDPWWIDPQREEWSEAKLELYLQFRCWKTFETEVHAYDLMRQMQGVAIPRFLAEVHLPLSAHSKKDSIDKYRDCPGILLEHIEGFSLSRITEMAPQSSWQRICDKAIAVILQAGDCGVCNRDVKTRSFIVDKSFDVFMIDFGLCVFRDEMKDAEEFEEWQANEDEEGAVGVVMHNKLDGGFTWNQSSRCLYLLDRYKSE